MSAIKASKESILQQIKTSPHKRIKVAITDIDGVLRGKYMHKEKFVSAVENGFGFCDVTFGWDCADVCYDKASITGWHTGYPDADVSLAPETLRFIPWDKGTPMILGDVLGKDGLPLVACPRQLLKKVISRSEAAGYRSFFGMEFEWFNFAETPQSLADKGFQGMKPMTPGMFGYSLLRSSLRQEYFNSIFDLMADFDVPLEGLHTETGPGVYEAAIQYSTALEAADRGVLFKAGVKEIAYRNEVIACFMARWNTSLPGCSGHTHQSLWDGNRNLFYDENDPQGMSDVFRSYIAGQLLCLPEILPMFAPTVNSYKRLVEGFWAPTRATWGIDNRTTALRAIRGGKKATRLETRVPGSDVNPYLAVAAALASGLYGVEKGLKLEQAAFEGNAYEAGDGHAKLPSSLKEASDRMAGSDLARELFGDGFVDHFTASRDWEWREFQKAVTDWELKRYFEII